RYYGRPSLDSWGTCWRRRVAVGRVAHRQYVHQLERVEHGVVAAVVRSGRYFVLGADGGIRDQRRAGQHAAEVRWEYFSRVVSGERLRTGSAGGQHHSTADGSRAHDGFDLAEKTVRHQWGHRWSDQARQVVVLFHLEVPDEQQLHRRIVLSSRSFNCAKSRKP